MTRWAPKEAAALSDPVGILTPGGIFEPEVYFAVNVPAGVVGSTREAATTTIPAWGFVVTPERIEDEGAHTGRLPLRHCGGIGLP